MSLAILVVQTQQLLFFSER